MAFNVGLPSYDIKYLIRENRNFKWWMQITQKYQWMQISIISDLFLAYVYLSVLLVCNFSVWLHFFTHQQLELKLLCSVYLYISINFCGDHL